MERIKGKRGSLNTDFAQAVLYRDDLDHIIEVMQERHGMIRIKDDDMVYNSLDEMRAHKGAKVKRLDLFTQREDIELTIGDRGLNLHSRSDDAKLYTHPQIEEILHRRRSFLGWLSNGQFWKYAIGVSFTLFACSMLFSTFAPLPKVVSYIITSVCFVIFVVFTLLGLAIYFIAQETGTTIYLVRQHETKNFWRDNSDRILAGAIGAVISGIATYIATRASGCSH